jgi:hypothetical protein
MANNFLNFRVQCNTRSHLGWYSNGVSNDPVKKQADAADDEDDNGSEKGSPINLKEESTTIMRFAQDSSRANQQKIL